jgi:hypothetical protein
MNALDGRATRDQILSERAGSVHSPEPRRRDQQNDQHRREPLITARMITGDGRKLFLAERSSMGRERAR